MEDKLMDIFRKVEYDNKQLKEFHQSEYMYSFDYLSFINDKNGNSFSGKNFFNQFGFIIIDNVIPVSQCNNTVNTILNITNINRNDQKTWNEFHPIGKYGLGSRGPSFERDFLINRQNERLANVLSILLDTTIDNVMVSHDRFALYRPTIREDDSEDIGFRTSSRNIHLDVNPYWWIQGSQDIFNGLDSLQYDDPQDLIKENNLVNNIMGTHIQCVINLEDNELQDGGTILVPSIHRYMSEFCEITEKSLFKPVPFVVFGKKEIENKIENLLLKVALRMTLRKGSVLLWNQMIFHGTTPNQSNKFRFVQYMKAFKRKESFFPTIDISQSNVPIPLRLKKRSNLILNLINQSNNTDSVSPLGNKLFGLDVLDD